MDASAGPFDPPANAGDDPFAGADEQFDQSGDDPFAEAGDQQTPPPQVDREGNPVQEPLGQDATQDASSATEEGGTSEPDPPVPPAQTNGESSDTPPPGQEDAAQAAAVPAESVESGSPSPASATTEPGTTESASETPPDDDIPDEKKDEKGKVTHRKYLIFAPTSQGKYEQLSWYETPDGKLVPKGTEGARKRSACLVRSKDDALAVGYAAVGAPPEGADLVAVTANYWKVKTVKPAPIQPTRSRLTIQ